MSVKTGTVTLPWADGDFSFRLAFGEWQELYRKSVKRLIGLGISEENAMAGSTPMAIYKRISSADPLPGELGDILFQALIGAGMEPKDATGLRRRYHDERPILECLHVTQAIVLVSLMGTPEPETDAPKKAEAGATPSGPSAASTETARRSDTRRKK